MRKYHLEIAAYGAFDIRKTRALKYIFSRVPSLWFFKLKDYLLGLFL